MAGARQRRERGQEVLLAARVAGYEHDRPPPAYAFRRFTDERGEVAGARCQARRMDFPLAAQCWRNAHPARLLTGYSAEVGQTCRRGSLPGWSVRSQTRGSTPRTVPPDSPVNRLDPL